MKRREQILLIMAALAVLYGIYTIFINPGGKKAPSKPSADRQAALLANISGQLTGTSGALEKRTNLILEGINVPWNESAFLPGGQALRSAPGLEQTTSSSLSPDDINYSGFLNMAGKRIAIINGIDYQEGDSVGDLLLTKVEPGMVELSDGRKSISVPIKEPE